MDATVSGTRTWLLRATTLAAGGLMALVACEIAVRAAVPARLWRFRDATFDWQVHPRLGWVQRPNLDVETRTDQGAVVRFRTNADGLTPFSAARERQAGVLRVLIVGDSTVVGRLVPQEATIHAQLERVLRARGRLVEVLNAGVEGYSTDQSLLRLEALLPLYRPHIVLHGICDNDLPGNAAAGASRLPKPRFRLQADGSLRETPPAPGGRIDAFAASAWRRALRHWATYRLVRPALHLWQARRAGNAERARLGLPPDVYWKAGAADALDWPLFGALVARMRDAAQSAGARLVLYAHPAPAEVWDPYVAAVRREAGWAPGVYDRHALESRFSRIAGRLGVPFCPQIDAFVARADRGPFHLLPHDPHCIASGYALTAELLAQALETTGSLDSTLP
jgi:hypothetical protein